jgi:Kef-type K+ transport system membrane component KefB
MSGLLITLGVLFLLGLVADQLGRATRLPRISMLLLLGLGAGGAGFDLIGPAATAWFDQISVVALTMVAFLLGGSLIPKTLAQHGRAIFTISVAVALATLVFVAAGLSVAGVPLGLALLLGAIATATDPAAVTDVIEQSKIDNGFTKTLKGIVAIDDAWGLVIFSVVVVLVQPAADWVSVFSGSLYELGGAIVLGCAIGAPAAYLTGRLKPGEPQQAEAIGIVFLTAGLALWAEVSFLMAGITVGTVIANFAKHHDRAFHEIENIKWPFMILFFLLAGASLEVEVLLSIGWMGVLFVVLRILARAIGGYLGARPSGVPQDRAKWYGPALLPQAGVAVGMALVAGEAFPDWAPTIMAFTIASTVVFELLGPPATLWAIGKTAAKSSDTAG